MEIRWKVTDPLGNEIFLSAENFSTHSELDERIKHAVAHPRLIVKAPNSSRKIYLNLIGISRKDSAAVRMIEVIVDENNEIVTWLIRRTIDYAFAQGDVIYDKQPDCL